MGSFDAFFGDVALGLMSLFGPWSEHIEPVLWSLDGEIDLIRVRAINGSLIVRGGDQDVTTVRAIKTVRGPTSEAAARFAPRVEIRMTHLGNGVLLQTLYPRPPLGCTVFVRYEITVPWSVDADLYTQSGGISVSDIEGAVEAETRSGNIDLLDTSGPATVYTASGHIHASGVEGAIQADNDQGCIVVDGCSGHIKLRTTSGDIEIDGCDGALYARSYRGSIRLNRGRGGAELETEGGDIRAHFEHLKTPGVFFSRTGTVDVAVAKLQGYLEAESLDGSVRVGLPADYSGLLDASTKDGMVRCDLQVDVTQRSRSLVTGVLGKGDGPLVKLRSFSGDIYVQREILTAADDTLASGDSIADENSPVTNET